VGSRQLQITASSLAWLRENGVETESVDKAHVTELLETDSLAPKVRHVLQLRSDAGRSSIAKLDAMLECASPSDDRARGMLLYHGASTGRWSGRLIQMQNFPRGTIADVESYIPLVLDRAYDTINLCEHRAHRRLAPAPRVHNGCGRTRAYRRRLQCDRGACVELAGGAG